MRNPTTTTTLEAQCNARPTRLAFILPTPDKELLVKVIARATSLWGGMYDPIVILDDSTRQTRGAHYTTLPPDPYIELQADILKAFDPDLLINFGPTPLPEQLAGFQHRTFDASRLDWKPWNRETESYFVDVWPLYEELWEREFKGNQTPRFKLRFLEKGVSEQSIFLAARYDEISDQTEISDQN